MKINKQKIHIAMRAVLCLLVCFGILETKSRADPVTLNVSLYKFIPDYDSFEKTVEECWKEKHPEVELNFVDWNCYEAEVPEDLDVFVLDTINLDVFAKKGFLLALSEEDIEEYEDLIPAFMEGCRVDGTICVVPLFLCTDLLFTREEDTELADIQNIDDLYAVLGDGELLREEETANSQVIMYLQALMDERQCYMDHFPSIEEGKLSPAAVESMEKLNYMQQKDYKKPGDGSMYGYALNFAEGTGRACISYSESMDVMDEVAMPEMNFRLFSMTDDENIPVFYVDAAAVNAQISEEKRALSLELLNLITGRDLLARASARDGEPRYLFTGRYSVYNALMDDYPIYAEMKEIALTPNAHPFRIKPDGVTYLEEARNNADVLPSLYD